MLKINKNNFDKWRLLLMVLCEEVSETDPEFIDWLNEDPENLDLYNAIKNNEDNGLFDRDKIFKQVSEKLSLNIENKTRSYSIKWIKLTSSIVAVILIILGIVHYAYQDKPQDNYATKTIYEPGSKKAYLLSQEGKVVDLSESFEIQKENGIVITNKSEGLISFHSAKPVKKKNETQTIYVPRGGEYKLLLSDGTQVYLNSDSELTFPCSFVGGKREVKLVGEAYFDVKKDSKPFIVNTNELSIEVLGTSFNVNSYNSNSSVHTTLVNGSIKVHLHGKNDKIILEPDNNLTLDKISSEFVVKQVNTAIYTSWVKGEFIFRNQLLKDIFSQLARWYDFSIKYEDPTIENMRFTGSVEKAKPLTYLLDQIKAVTDIQYKSEGDKIVLYK